jgi:prepilin-type N-terminal cleavage/methylation domain-containing protein
LPGGQPADSDGVERVIIRLWRRAMCKRDANKGFTLVELVVMIVVLSTLATVAVQKYLDMRNDAVDASARALLGALRTANQLVYSKKLLTGASPAYTMGGVVAFVDNLHVEHINYSNHGMKWHIRILGQEYWYTMSSPGNAFPSVSEWKPDQWPEQKE